MFEISINWDPVGPKHQIVLYQNTKSSQELDPKSMERRSGRLQMLQDVPDCDHRFLHVRIFDSMAGAQGSQESGPEKPSHAVYIVI